jgi:hypothetical protein
MTYQGSCHCGAIAFDVTGELGPVTACNCSICQRKGVLMWFVPRTALTLRTHPDAMRTYRFNTHKIAHHFCPTCGIHPFGEANDPAGNPVAAVNARCLEGVDVDALEVNHFDGRSKLPSVVRDNET